MMQIPTFALPLAAAAAGQVVRQVGEVVAHGVSFAQALAATTPSTGTAAEAGAHPGNFEPDVAGALRRRTADLQALEADTADLQQELLAWSIEHQVRLDEPIVIRTDADQRLLVANSHSDRGAIEELLQGSSELAARLRRLFARAEDLYATHAADGRADVRLVLDRQQAFWTAG